MRQRQGGFYRRKHVKQKLPGGAVVDRAFHLPVDSDYPGVIYYRYQVDGKRKSFCTGTKDLAEARLRVAKFLGVIAFSDREQYLRSMIELGREAEKELHGAKFAARRVRLADAWEEYLASKRRPDSGPRTLRGYRAHWMEFKAWVDRPGLEALDQVSPALAESFVDHLEKAGLRRGTVVQKIQFLRLLFSVLAAGQENPFHGLKPTRAGTAGKVPYRRLTVDECARIVANASAGGRPVPAREWALLCRLGYFTGLRLGDACLLRWELVDLKASAIVGLVLRKTAGTSGARVDIPLPGALVEALREAGPLKKGFVLPGVARMYEADAPEVSKRLAAIFAAAKVGDGPGGRASFHSFRVTFQSLNDDAGTPRAHIRAILGHVSSAMSDTYSRLDVARARKGVERAVPAI